MERLHTLIESSDYSSLCCVHGSGGRVAGGGGLLRVGALGHLAWLAVRTDLIDGRRPSNAMRGIMSLNIPFTPHNKQTQEVQDAATKSHLRGGALRGAPLARKTVGGGGAARALEPLRRVLQRGGAVSFFLVFFGFCLASLVLLLAGRICIYVNGRPYCRWLDGYTCM